jgi:hemerythrin
VPLIEWDSSFQLDISEIDKQHQMLIKMLNDLYVAMQFKKKKAELGKLLNRMSVYAAFHFAKEENLLEMSGYPDTDTHITEHSDFEKKVFAFEQKFASGRADLSMEIMTFLGDWLADHIKGSDRNFATFFTSQGVQ